MYSGGSFFRVWPGLFLGLIVCLLPVACKNKSEPVDTQYINSEEYRQFAEDSRKEFYAQINRRRSMQAYLSKLINCGKGAELSLPLQIDVNSLQLKFAEDYKECETLKERNNAAFNAYEIGYFTFGEIDIHWILVDIESIYRNQELLAATYRDTTLVDFKTVGSFKKNLAQNISTDIRVFKRGGLIYIDTSLQRKIMYPIEQENIVRTTYVIESGGIITAQ